MTEKGRAAVLVVLLALSVVAVGMALTGGTAANVTDIGGLNAENVSQGSSVTQNVTLTDVNNDGTTESIVITLSNASNVAIDSAVVTDSGSFSQVSVTSVDSANGEVVLDVPEEAMTSDIDVEMTLTTASQHATTADYSATAQSGSGTASDSFVIEQTVDTLGFYFVASDDSTTGERDTLYNTAPGAPEGDNWNTLQTVSTTLSDLPTHGVVDLSGAAVDNETIELTLDQGPGELVVFNNGSVVQSGQSLTLETDKHGFIEEMAFGNPNSGVAYRQDGSEMANQDTVKVSATVGDVTETAQYTVQPKPSGDINTVDFVNNGEATSEQLFLEHQVSSTASAKDVTGFAIALGEDDSNIDLTGAQEQNIGDGDTITDIAGGSVSIAGTSYPVARTGLTNNGNTLLVILDVDQANGVDITQGDTVVLETGTGVVNIAADETNTTGVGVGLIDFQSNSLAEAGDTISYDTREVSDLNIVGQGSDARITEGDNGDISVVARNPEGGSRSIDVSLDIGNGDVVLVKSTSTLAVGESETVTFSGVTDSLPVGEHTVEVATPNSTTTGTLEVLESVSDADSEVAIGVAPPGDGSFTTSETIEVFAGAYTETSTTHLGLPNKDLTIDIKDTSGSVVNTIPVTTGRNGQASTTADLSGQPPGEYSVTVNGFSGKSATATFIRGPIVDIMNNRNAGMLVGDQTTVSALVRSGEGSVASEDVDVTVKDPDGTTVLQSQETTDGNGFIEVAFTPQKTGTYTITTALTNYADSETLQLQAATATLGSDFDLRRAITGEETVYGGYVRTASGQLTNTNLTVTFRNQTTSEIELTRDVTTDANGFFLIGYQTPDDVDDSMLVQVQRENEDTVHTQYGSVFIDDSATTSEEVSVDVSQSSYRVAPGETIELTIKATDGNGDPITNKEVDIFAGWTFNEIPALSDTVVTDSNGMATVTYTVPDNVNNNLRLDGRVAFVHNGEVVSDGIFTRVQRFRVDTDWRYNPGSQSDFTLNVTDKVTGDAVSDFPVQFAALYGNYKSDSIVTGVLVTDAAGSASTTVSIPTDVGPREVVNEVHRYTSANSNRYVTPAYPGTLSLDTNTPSPGEDATVEFVTPNGESASGIVYGDIGEPDGSIGTEVVGDDPTTLTIPEYAEPGEYVRLHLWAYGEGQFYTDSVTIEVGQSSSDGGDGTDTQETTEGPTNDVSTTDIEFGDIRVGERETETVTVENNGGQTLELDVSIDGDDAFDSDATLLSSESIAPGESATYEVRAAPTGTGAVEGTLVFDTNAGTESVDLSARGVESEFELRTESVDFGSVGVNAIPTESIVIRNNGTASLSVGDISLGGNTAVFELDTDGGFELGANEERTIGLTYRPDEAGTNQATVTIDDPNENRFGTVDVTAEARESQLTVSPNTLEFGQQSVRDAATREITLETTVDDSLDVALSVDSDHYSIDTPERTVGDNETVTVPVTYEPTRGGTHNGTLTVTGPDGTEGTVALSGSATAPRLAVTPKSVQFEETAVDAAVSETVTVRNTGNEPLEIRQTELSENDVFGLDDGAPFTLDPDESRELSVTFTPDDEQSNTAYLRIGSSDPVNPNRVVSLSSGNIETTVEVDEQNRTTTSATIRDVSSGERATVDLPDAVEEEGYNTENVTVVPEEDTDLEVNITSSGKALDTTPDTDAGFENGTDQVGNVSANTNLDNEDIEEVEMATRIDQSRLEEMDSKPEDVVLQRYNESQERWVEQETNITVQDDGSVIARARGDGFSEWTAAAKSPVLNISDTNIDVQTATTEDDVTIQVLVTNTGGADGSYEAVLFQNEEEIDRQERTVPNGGTVGINFVRSFDNPGDYQLEVNEVFVGEVTISAADQDVEVEEVENPDVEAADDGSDGERTDGSTEDGSDGDTDEITEDGDDGGEDTDDGGRSPLLIGGIVVVLAIIAGAGGLYYRRKA